MFSGASIKIEVSQSAFILGSLNTKMPSIIKMLFGFMVSVSDMRLCSSKL